MSGAERIRAALGARSYEVVAGPGVLADAGREMRALGPVRRAFVVTDALVGPLHAAALVRSLSDSGIAAPVVTVEPGEGTKSFAGLERLCDSLLDLQIERGDWIVALGGGVVGDLAGFAAGVLKRGTPYVQCPTTLLAQVDSSVGGKTAINARQGKNLIGLFHQPRLVLADTATLDTLPQRHMTAGFAEVVKYGLMGDAQFFSWLETHGAAALAAPGPERQYAIAHSIRTKARVVALDEREDGIRALLNLGHTFGHALEAESGFSDRLLHGEAVAIGMVLAFQLSEALGHCAAGTAARVAGFLRQCGLPTSPRAIFPEGTTAEPLMAHMRHDKKNRGGRITLILARGAGEAFADATVPEDAILKVLARALAP
jgi:3-dehydroquinate synthase